MLLPSPIPMLLFLLVVHPTCGAALRVFSFPRQEAPPQTPASKLSPPAPPKELSSKLSPPGGNSPAERTLLSLPFASSFHHHTTKPCWYATGGETSQWQEELTVDLLHPEETIEEALAHLQYYGYCSLLPFLREGELTKLLLLPRLGRNSNSESGPDSREDELRAEEDDSRAEAIPAALKNWAQCSPSTATSSCASSTSLHWGSVYHRGFQNTTKPAADISAGKHLSTFHIDPAQHRLNLWFPLPEGLLGDSQMGVRTDLSEDEILAGFLDFHSHRASAAAVDPCESHRSTVAAGARKVILLMRPRLAHEHADATPPSTSDRSFFEPEAFGPRHWPKFETFQNFKTVAYTRGPVAFVASLLPHAGAMLRAAPPSSQDKHPFVASLLPHAGAMHAMLREECLSCEDGGAKKISLDQGFSSEKVYSSEIRALQSADGFASKMFQLHQVPKVFEDAGIDVRKYVADAASSS